MIEPYSFAQRQWASRLEGRRDLFRRLQPGLGPIPLELDDIFHRPSERTGDTGAGGEVRTTVSDCRSAERPLPSNASGGVNASVAAEAHSLMSEDSNDIDVEVGPPVTHQPNRAASRAAPAFREEWCMKLN